MSGVSINTAFLLTSVYGRHKRQVVLERWKKTMHDPKQKSFGLCQLKTKVLQRVIGGAAQRRDQTNLKKG